jgi:hypothetical protein
MRLSPTSSRWRFPRSIRVSSLGVHTRAKYCSGTPEPNTSRFSSRLCRLPVTPTRSTP